MSSPTLPDNHSHSDSDSENHPLLNRNTNSADLFKLYDISNLNNNDDPGSRSKRQRIHRSPTLDNEDEDDSAVTSSRTDKQFVYQAGHKFFLIHCPWIHDGADLFTIDLDNSYNAAEHFENGENKAQGQLQEVMDLLQEKLEQQALRQRWVSRAFVKGLNAQRHNTATRICRHCAAMLGVNEMDFLKPETRKTKFRDRIGWVSNESGGGSYLSVDVEILHKDYSGEYLLSSVFLNPILMGLYVTFIRGPTAAKHFMDGSLFYPQTETMAHLHSIRNITPGAIATTSILARWALSCDSTLQKVGSSTGIRYFKDCEQYLNILESGLRRKKKSVINIIKQWDKQIFPDLDTSLLGAKVNPEDDADMKRAMDLLDADEEEEDGGSGKAFQNDAN